MWPQILIVTTFLVVTSCINLYLLYAFTGGPLQ